MNPPVNSEQQEDEEFTFMGWSPALGPIKENTTYKASYQDNRSLVVQYLTGSLTKFESESSNEIRVSAFKNIEALESVKTGETYVNNSYDGTSITTIDFTSNSQITFSQYAFTNLSSLKNVIIRSSQKASVTSTNTFYNTQIARCNGAIYVNENLIDSYTEDDYWRNYIILPLSYYPASARQLYEAYDARFSTTTDSWQTIATNKNYATDYTVGTKKAIDGGTFGPIMMQLVAFNQDDKADGSGKARMTWISRDLIARHVMNKSGTTTRNGKYGETGWAGSEMREWLIDDVLPQIDSDVSGYFVPVTKTQSIYADNAVQINGQTTTDSIWIPSVHEIFGTETYESQGPIYTGWFNSSSRVIKIANTTSGTWWLRSASSSNSFRFINTNGNADGSSASNALWMAFGFCL